MEQEDRTPQAPARLIFVDPHDDSLDLIEAVQNRKLHYIALAQPGLTKAFALAEFSPGIGHQRAGSLFSKITKASETGTLLPRRHLTFLPTPSASYTGIDRTIYRENGYSREEVRTHLSDALKAHRSYARCDKIYFDFREAPVDQGLYHECLEFALSEADLPPDIQAFTWK